MAIYQFQPIEAIPGVDKDNTLLSTRHYTDASNIRFVNGKPQKIGGFDSLTFDESATIDGCARTLYSQLVGTTALSFTLIGTHKKLYSLNNARLTNITPVLSTLLALGANPLATTNTSQTVTATHTAHGLSNNNDVILTGAATTNGIPAAELNTSHNVSSVATNTYDIEALTPATSTASGGGTAVIAETGVIKLSESTTLGTDPLTTTAASAVVTVAHTTHGFATGIKVRMSGSPIVDTIPADELNNIHTITVTGASAYTITVSSTASAGLTGGGAGIAIENSSLDSNFQTLGATPFATVDTSATVTVTSPAIHRLQIGDTATIAGVTGGPHNGIPITDLNKQHIVRTVPNTTTYTIIVATVADATGNTGAGTITQGTGIITIAQTAHLFANDDVVRIQLSEGFAGFSAGDINIAQIIRNVSSNEYDIVISSDATSSVIAGGSVRTTVQGEIADGDCDASFGSGYGLGLYGVGLYGVPKTGASSLTLPRIWSFDRFGNNVVLTPGSQGKLYEWTGINTTVPVTVLNAPTAINYVFVSDNIVITLGASAIINRIQWSDQGNSTTWTETATNQAGQDDIEGSNEFLSQAHVRGVNLLFTKDQIWTFRYIGRPLIWETKLIDTASGIIGRNARVVHNGICYWMGEDDFFFYSGGVVKALPSNTGVNYVRDFVFSDINRTQASKSFVWYNKKFSEVWFHYPSASSSEPDKVVRFSTKELHWTPDSIDRTAAENPRNSTQFPYLIDKSNKLFRHEKGVDADGSALSWSLSSPFYQVGSDEIQLDGIIPDSTQTNDITVTLITRPYPQVAASQTSTAVPVTTTSGKVDLRITDRNWRYVWSQSSLSGEWRMGDWFQRIKAGSPK